MFQQYINTRKYCMWYFKEMSRCWEAGGNNFTIAILYPTYKLQLLLLGTQNFCYQVLGRRLHLHVG